MKKLYFFIVLWSMGFCSQAQHFAGGNGTQGNPWQISQPSHLDNLLKYYTNTEAYFVLTDHISMSDYITSNYGENGWLPAPGTFRFKGHLDGGGKIISGLWKKDSNAFTGGLFGSLDGGTIQNVGIELDVRGIEAKYFAGGLVGINRGTIIGCFVKGGAILSMEYPAGIGGLVGRNMGSISFCHTSTMVKGKNFIIYPYTNPPAIGGFVGFNEGNISESYSLSEVVSNRGGGSFVGYNSEGGQISRSYYYSDNDKLESVGSAFTDQREDIFKKSIAEMKFRNTFTDWDFTNIWKISEECSLPLLMWEVNAPDCPWCFPEMEGTLENPYLITSAEELECLRYYVGKYGRGRYFKVMSDIDLEELNLSSWIPIGSIENENKHFCGYLLGEGHIIKGLTIDHPTMEGVGLFSVLGRGGKIENLGIEIPSSGAIKGGNYTGALAGINHGEIFACYINGMVESAAGTVGGLVGCNRGEIKSSYSTGKVKGISYTGGLVGKNAGGLIETSYSASNVRESSGTKSGLFGQDSSGVIIASYFDYNTAGVSAGNIGKATALMKTKSTFSAPWNFDEIWRMMEGETYPLLFWQTCEHEVTFTGPVAAYNGTHSYIYTAPKGYQNYIWKATGGNFPQGNKKDSAHVKWAQAGIRQVSVNYKDSQGCFSYNPPVLNVEVQACNLQVNITGSSNAYQYLRDMYPTYDPSYEYTYTTTGGLVSYEWEIYGGVIISGRGTNQVKVLWEALGEQHIGVACNDTNGCRSYKYLTVNVAERAYHAGHGTVVSPYRIYTAQDLDSLRSYSGAKGEGKYFIVMNDIYLGDYINEHYPGGWSPIGDFRGILLGDMNEIHDLRSSSFGGLFGMLSGEVSQLGIVNYVLNGESNVGAIAGALSSNGKISHCYAAGKIISGENMVGGLVGTNNGLIEYSKSYIEIKNAGNYVGGIVGDNGGIISKCYAHGTIRGNERVGGIAGHNETSIEQSHAYVFVEGETRVGGIVGYTFGDISKCYTHGFVKGNNEVGGLIGRSGIMDFQECYSAAIILPKDYINASHGYLFGQTDYSCMGYFAYDYDIQCFTLNPNGTNSNLACYIPILNTTDQMMNGSIMGPGFWGYKYYNYPYLPHEEEMYGYWRGAPTLEDYFISSEIVDINRFFPWRMMQLEGYMPWSEVVLGDYTRNVCMNGLVCNESLRIDGSNNAVEQVRGNIYTIAEGKKGYTWTVAGGVINSGQGTNSVEVIWNTLGNQTINLSYQGELGCQDNIILDVYVRSCRPTITITGSSTAERGIQQTYSTQTGKSNYTWSISSGGRIVSGQGTSRIIVEWVSNGNRSVSVNYRETTGCYASSPKQLNITVIDPADRCFAGGNGTSGNPYRIETAQQFECLRNYTGNVPLTYFELVRNINLSNSNWLPIGTSTAPFRCILNGNGYTVSNFSIPNGGSNVGLFGVSEGTIKNLFIKFTTGRVEGTDNVGGLVGVNKGTIYNCHVTGTVLGDDAIGGVAGVNEGIIELSGSNIRIQGNTNLGGLVGYNCWTSGSAMQKGYIKASYSNSMINGNSIIGGLVGKTTGNIEECFAIAWIEGQEYIGGLVGRNSVLNGADYSIQNSYSMGVLQGCNNIGGFIGHHMFLPVAFSYSTCKIISTCGNSPYINGFVGRMAADSVIWQTSSVYRWPLWHCVFDSEYGGYEIGDDCSLSIGEQSHVLSHPNFYYDNFGISAFQDAPWTFSHNCQSYPYLRWQEQIIYDKYIWYEVMNEPGFTDEALLPYLDGYMNFLWNSCSLHDMFYYPYDTYFNEYYGAPKNPNVNNTLGIKDNISEKKEIVIYPNPTTGIIQIEMEEISPEIKVFDVKGLELIKTRQKTIDLSGYPSGVYFVELQGKVTKVIKQ